MALITFSNITSVSPQCPTLPDGAKALTKSDTDTYNTAIIVYCGGTGDIAVVPVNGAGSVTFTNFPAGQVLPVRVVQVLSTGTTATGLVGIY